jgi:hypothetical protein
MVSPNRYDNDSDRGELPKASPWQAGSRNSGELQPAIREISELNLGSQNLRQVSI